MSESSRPGDDFSPLVVSDLDARIASIQDQQAQDRLETNKGLNELRLMMQVMLERSGNSAPPSAPSAVTSTTASMAPPSQAVGVLPLEPNPVSTSSAPAPVLSTAFGLSPAISNAVQRVIYPSFDSSSGLINPELISLRAGQVAFFTPTANSAPQAAMSTSRFTSDDWNPDSSPSLAPTNLQKTTSSQQLSATKSVPSLARVGSLDATDRASESCREFFSDYDPCITIPSTHLDAKRTSFLREVTSLFTRIQPPAGANFKYVRDSPVVYGWSADEHLRNLRIPLENNCEDEQFRGLAILQTLPLDKRELWKPTHDELYRRSLYVFFHADELRRARRDGSDSGAARAASHFLPSWSALTVHFLSVMSHTDGVLEPHLVAWDFAMVPGSNPLVFQIEWLRLHQLAGLPMDRLLDEVGHHVLLYRKAIPVDDWDAIYRKMTEYIRCEIGFRKTTDLYKWCLRHVHAVHCALFDESAHARRAESRVHPDVAGHAAARARENPRPHRGSEPAAQSRSDKPPKPPKPQPAGRAPPLADRCTLHPDGWHTNAECRGRAAANQQGSQPSRPRPQGDSHSHQSRPAPAPVVPTPTVSRPATQIRSVLTIDSDEDWQSDEDSYLPMRSFWSEDVDSSSTAPALLAAESPRAASTRRIRIFCNPDDARLWLEGSNAIDALADSSRLEVASGDLDPASTTPAGVSSGVDEERLVVVQPPSPREERSIAVCPFRFVARSGSRVPVQPLRRPARKVKRARRGPNAHSRTRNATRLYPSYGMRVSVNLPTTPSLPVRSLQATTGRNRRHADEVVRAVDCPPEPWNPDDPDQVAELLDQPEVDDAPRVPLTLVNQNTSMGIQLHNAVWDTGAMCSMITAVACRSINLPFSEVANARLSVPGGTAAKLMTDYPVKVFIGDKVRRMRFIVDPTNRHTLIGQDLIRVLGGPQAKWPYEFAHVPGYFEKVAPPDVDAPQAASVSGPAAAVTSRHHEEIAAWAMAELEKNNALIAPDERCTHPAAMVHVIHKAGTKPSFRPQYPYAEKFVHFVDVTVAQWILEGKIIPLASFPPLYCMPLLPLVKAVDAQGNIVSIRLTVDARGINIGLEFTPFPLPDMRELLRKLTGTLFTELDLQSFFTQMPVHPDSQHKLVIQHRGRYYQWTVAPFGLASLPAQAQLLMNAVLMHCSRTAAYIDNVTTGSEDSASAHIAALKPVFEALLRWRLRLTIPKAKIAQLRLAALGYQREGNTVALADDKKEAVRSWPTPENKDSLARFLGFTCFLRDHIFDYAAKTRILEAVKKSPRFDWTAEAQLCFDRLKEEIYHNALVLKVFDESKPTYIITDASTVGLAGILYQPDPADAEMPTPNNLVYLCSRAARGAEQAYPAYKAELNAGRYAMAKFKQYLYGRRFTWLTDHRSLTFMTDAAELNRTLLNWREEFANFTFDVRHVDGAHNIMADALSRCYPDRFRAGAAVRSVQPAPPESESDRRQRLARCAHLWGHWGVRATLVRLHQQGHDWPNMESAVRFAIDNCNACRQWSLGLPRSSPITAPNAEQPWSHIAFDPVEMPVRNGLRTLVVIVDQFSGYVLLRAAPDKSAPNLAQILWQVIADFGPPRRIHSDGEATNVAAVLAALRSMHGVEHETITPYNPQQNGKAEAAVKTTLTLIQKLLTDSGSPWPSVLGSVQLMMNTKTRSLTRIDPFRLMFGRAAVEFDLAAELGPDPQSPADPLSEYKEWLAAQYAQVSELWPGRLEHVRQEQNKAAQFFADRHRIAKVPLPLDVWVMCKNTTRASKQEPPFEGPFKIVAYDEKAKAYTVVDAADEKSKRQVPMSHLKPIIHYRHDQQSETTYHVEEILDHRVIDGKDEFLIKWYGFPVSESTWAKRADMNGQRAILEFFKNRERAKPNRAKKPPAKKRKTSNK